MKPKPLQLKITARNFRKRFGESNLVKEADGYHAIAVPSSVTEPFYYIYEVVFDNDPGDITEIIRRTSLGEIVPCLKNDVFLSKDPSLLKELDTIIKTDGYTTVTVFD